MPPETVSGSQPVSQPHKQGHGKNRNEPAGLRANRYSIIIQSPIHADRDPTQLPGGKAAAAWR
jgi:hypothetical protein